jgi:hypothetical protein
MADNFFAGAELLSLSRHTSVSSGMNRQPWIRTVLDCGQRLDPTRLLYATRINSPFCDAAVDQN